MKAEDFRIGNLVLYKGKIVKLTMVGEFGVKANMNDTTINAKFFTPDIQPIPLTSQIFIDFGFETQYSISYLTGRGVEYRVFLLKGFSFNEIQKNWWYKNILLPTQPLSVHQLQNLYFALTGEELTTT